MRASLHFSRVLERAFKVGADAAKIAYERRINPHSHKIGYSLIYLPLRHPFTEWALKNEHAFSGLDEGETALLFCPELEGVPSERPEIEAARALAVQRSLLHSGIDGVTVRDISAEHEA